MQYAETLSRTLTSSFSRDEDRAFPVTIYTGDCPMLAVAIQLEPSTGRTTDVKAASGELLSVLSKMDIALLEKHDSGLYYREQYLLNIVRQPRNGHLPGERSVAQYQVDAAYFAGRSGRR